MLLLVVISASCSKYGSVIGEMPTPQIDFTTGFSQGAGTMIPNDPSDPDSMPMFVTNMDPAVIRLACTGKEIFEIQNGFSLFWTSISVPCVNGIAEITFPVYGQGEHEIKIRSRKDDVVSLPIKFKLLIDQVTPANPPISSGVINNPVYSGNLSSYPLAGTCTEVNSTILIQITDANGDVVNVTPAPICLPDLTWSTTVDLSLLADGDLNLSVQIRDLGGNLSSPEVAVIAKDTPLRTIFATVASQVFNESGVSFNVRVELSSAFVFPTTFGLSYTTNTTFDGARDNFNNGSFTIPAGVTFIDIPVSVTDDNVFDSNKLIEFELLTSEHATIDDTKKLHMVSVVNDDALPTARFSVASMSLSEASASGTFTVELTGTRSAFPVTVPYTVADVSGGVAKLDNFPNGNVVIPANSTSATVTFNLEADNDVNEGDSDFQVNLAAPSDDQGNTLATVTPVSLNVTVEDDDTPPVVGFTGATGSVSENGSTYSFAYSVSRAFSQPITVNLTLAGTAGRNTDFTDALGNAIPSASFSLTIPAFTTSGNYTISVVNDGNDENDETVSLTMTGLSSPNGTPVLGANPAKTLTIADDEANPVITLSGGGSFDESTGSVTLTASLSHASELTVSAPYTLDYQTTSSFDHDAFNGNLTFSPLETTKTITINLTNDTMDEPNESFSITLSGSPTNGIYPLPNLSQVVTIEDNDAEPTVQISASGATFNEGSGSFTITMTMSAASGHAISVPVLRSGTAVNPADYTLAATSFIIPATVGNPATGTVTNSITVSLVEDTTFDSNKSIRFDLDPALRVAIHPTINNATVTINENDSQPRPRFEFSAINVSEGDATGSFNISLATNSSDLAVTVPYTVSNVSGGTTKLSSFASGSVVIPAGSTTANVVFNLIPENDINDGDMVFRVNLGSATTSGGHTLTNTSPTQLDVTIRDNDTPPVISFATSSATLAEPGGQYTFTIQTSRPYSQAITLNVTLAGSATRNTDYFDQAGANISSASFSLSIPANTSSITHVVSVFNDNIDENNETISLTLNSASSSLGSPTIGGTSVHTLTVSDDESAPTIILSTSSLVESAGTYNVVASLSHPSSFAVSSPFTVTQGTASAFDHNGASGTVSFAALETSKNIPISITSDTMDEPDETFTIVLSGTCSNCAFASPNVTHTVTITDDDAAPTITLSSSSLSLQEWTSGAVTLTMTMSAPSGWPISVPLNVSGTATSASDYTLSGTTFTIAATTGNPAAGLTSATLSFTMIDDTALEPAETIELSLGSPSNTSPGSPTSRTINIGATNAPNFVVQSAPSNWGTSNVSRTRDYVFRNTGNEASGTLSSFVLSSAHSGYSLGTNGCSGTTIQPFSTHSSECTVRVNFDYHILGTYTANWAMSDPRSNSLSGSISATMNFNWGYTSESFNAPSGGSYLGSYTPNGSYSGTCEQRGWSAYQPAWQGGSYWDCTSLSVGYHGTYNCYVQETTTGYGYCYDSSVGYWQWNGNCTITQTVVGGTFEYYSWSYSTYRYSCGSTSGDSRYQGGSGGSTYKYWCSSPDYGVPGEYTNSCGGCGYNTYQYTSNYYCQ